MRARRFRWRLASWIVGRRDWQHTFRLWVESGYDLAQRGQKLPWHTGIIEGRTTNNIEGKGGTVENTPKRRPEPAGDGRPQVQVAPQAPPPRDEPGEEGRVHPDPLGPGARESLRQVAEDDYRQRCGGNDCCTHGRGVTDGESEALNR